MLVFINYSTFTYIIIVHILTVRFLKHVG